MASPIRADVTVTWPTVRASFKRPATVHVHQVDYKHEMCVIDYYTETTVAKRYKEGTPVKVQWGFLPNNVETFYGTVLYIRPHVENDRHLMRVVCIGASYKDKQVAAQISLDMSIEHFLAAEARRDHFDIIRAESTERVPVLARTTKETRWQYSVQLAKRLGYVYFVNKTTVHCYDPIDMLLANLASWPQLRYEYGHGNKFGDIVSFTPFLGDQGGPGQQQRIQHIAGVDPRTVAVVGAERAVNTVHLASAHASPRFEGFLTGQPFHSLADARARVDGARAQNRWVAKAHAQVWGNAKVRNGTGVYISGVSKESDGLWYVHAVDHGISAEQHPSQVKYFMELTLLRDSRENNYHAPPKRQPERSVLSSVGVQRNRRAAVAALRDGYWVSSRPAEVIFRGAA